MLGKASLLDASADIFSIVANPLDSVFGQIVVPRHVIMLKERKKALAISEQALL